MARFSWILLAFLGFGVGANGSPLLAQARSTTAEPSPFKFGLGGGATIPLGDFDDQNDLGWHGLALFRLRPAGSPVGFQVDGQYHQLNFADGFLAGAGKTQIVNGTANIVFTIPTSAATRFKPYLIGGAGVYWINLNPDVGPDNDVTKFGLNGGAGFDIGAGAAVFFVEGRFHNVFDGTIDDIGGTSDASLIPVTIGVKFGGQ